MDFSLRYVGPRFEGKRLPLDVLSDLPAFRDLLVAFAKEEWRKSNDRQRVPKGFDKSITFDLVGVRDGSAIPQIEWNREIAQARLPGFTDEIEDIVDYAYNTVVALIDNAGINKFPQSLSADHIRALNKLGSGLQDNERIEFQGTQGHDGNVVYLDSLRRKNLITHVKETYEVRVESVGRLVKNDYDDGCITVQTDEYGEIRMPMDREKVKATFDGNLNELVQFDIQMMLDHNDNFRGVAGVFEAAVIDAQIGADLTRCATRLREIRELEAGWHDGAGAAIDRDAATAAGKFLSRRPAMCALYRIYPTEAGGVVFEFEKNGWDFSVEFVPGGAVEMYGVDLNGNAALAPLEFAGVSDEFVIAFDMHAGLNK